MDNRRYEGRMLTGQSLVGGVGAAVLIGAAFWLPKEPNFARPHGREDVIGELKPIVYLLFVVALGYLGYFLALVSAGLLTTRLGVWLYRRYQAWHAAYNCFD